MEFIEQLRRVAEETGEHPSDEELQEHMEFCARTEEHIFLGEADMIAEELAASVASILRLNQFDPQAKRACTALLMCIVARCAKEDQALARTVKEMLAEIAMILVTDRAPVLAGEVSMH